MALMVVQDESANPIDLRFFRAFRVMEEAKLVTNLVEQPVKAVLRAKLALFRRFAATVALVPRRSAALCASERRDKGGPKGGPSWRPPSHAQHGRHDANR